ncbi:alpha-2,8-sialyltransferase 8F-like, partial [Salvelinus fontinalis]|uniref:alpha-2,8-sialyltransferase 8F-like n=1 Tax=Salvelinus fontinalis TaxID=8038 RepID=UPI00248623CD
LVLRYSDLQRNPGPLVEVMSVYGHAHLLLHAFSFGFGTSPCFKVYHALRKARTQQKVVFFHPDYLLKLDKFWRRRGQRAPRLSTGMMLASTALEICEQAAMLHEGLPKEFTVYCVEGFGEVDKAHDRTGSPVGPATKLESERVLELQYVDDCAFVTHPRSSTSHPHSNCTDSYNWAVILQVVHLYGFWPFPLDLSKNTLPHHYYDNVGPSHFMHAMPEEFLLLLQLHSQGALQLHVGPCTP